MAEDTTNLPDEQETADEATSSGGGGSLLAKLKIVLFVLIVIAAECVVAYLYLPSQSEVAAMAGTTLQTDDEADPLFEPGDEVEEPEDLIEQVEVDLKSYSVTAFQPISNSTLRIDFHLWGTVAKEDLEQFTTSFEENENRIREQVFVVIRSSDITDLTDAGLGLIKRKILEKSNRTLGKPYLRAVIFSDFSFFEQ